MSSNRNRYRTPTESGRPPYRVPQVRTGLAGYMEESKAERDFTLVKTYQRCGGGRRVIRKRLPT